MKHKEAHKPAPKPAAKPVEAVQAPEPQLVDELAEALRDMVNSAVTAGGRDRPDVVHAQEILAKHEKPE